MLISQPISRCLTNHSDLSMSRLLNNQPRLFLFNYRLQRRPSFGFESSVSSTPMTSGDPVVGYVSYNYRHREDVERITRPTPLCPPHLTTLQYDSLLRFFVRKLATTCGSPQPCLEIMYNISIVPEFIYRSQKQGTCCYAQRKTRALT